MRIRQLVFASGDMDAGDKLKALLGLGEPFRDPGVEVFGLVNVVHPVGDQFLEIVFPVTDAAPARRFLDRSGGEGGYMAIFQTDDLAAVRERAGKMGVRRVWDIDLEDISASHFHPADLGAAIVSIDEPRPPQSWRWGGDGWTERKGAGDCAGLAGMELVSPDPAMLAARWAEALGVDCKVQGDAFWIELDKGEIIVRQGPRESLSAFTLSCKDPDEIRARAERMGLSADQDVVRMCGVRLDLQPAD